MPAKKKPKMTAYEVEKQAKNIAAAEKAEKEAAKFHVYVLVTQAEMLLAEIICALVKDAEYDQRTGKLKVPVKG